MQSVTLCFAARLHGCPGHRRAKRRRPKTAMPGQDKRESSARTPVANKHTSLCRDVLDLFLIIWVVSQFEIKVPNGPFSLCRIADTFSTDRGWIIFGCVRCRTDSRA